MNPAQRHTSAEQRRHQIAELYIRGTYQSVIAQQLGCSQQQVSYDLKAIRKAWLASALRNFDEAKAQELAKLDEAEKEYWGAWKRSQEPREVTTTRAAEAEGEGPRRAASRRLTQSVGDVRFLDGVLKCVERRCDLLGLSTATEAAKAVSTGLAALLAQAQSRVPRPAPLAEA
jgi:hypothetical protein